MIKWNWLYRDFLNAFKNSELESDWIKDYKELYLKPHQNELEDLHFDPKGFLNEANSLSRISELGKDYFQEMVLEIENTIDYEAKIVSITEDILKKLHNTTVEQEVFVIVGLECMNIYSVEYKDKIVTVICLEFVQGSLEGLKLLLSHECHHWIRQLFFTYNLFEDSIGERIITEGLASCFTEELVPGHSICDYCFVPESTVEWTLENISQLDHLILQNVKEDTLTSSLFSRTPEKQLIANMPPRVGYVYGYLKVKDYKEKLNKDCIDLKGMNWEGIIFPKVSPL
ncbi:DUF2268 domain-containing putative Zn-dependent protease [Bacillus gaemokensis]|uniref:DUF2268 domain-containing protein n=1 Tax=Bacillus gaemokensis TaxID=574375 RepID=A0A073K757_9BACI|nr:DUF2268 domain-containing putative Zn-dependent protease [Bacillus gaemokensis]KEK23114.1 hypothetical protein BAGA_14000 [Bacillus gaemokensis]KYG37546.1 hypothetical protein AZF08_23305 [Bacillus gaemokensis]